jgi:hypothetical protein
MVCIIVCIYITIRMSFTRFHDDPARIEKGLEQSTFAGRYQLDTPGPGVKLPYIANANTKMGGKFGDRYNQFRE